MKCPECGDPRTRVIETREYKDDGLVMRYRRCEACDCTFRTHERQVWKRYGRWSSTPVAMEGDE